MTGDQLEALRKERGLDRYQLAEEISYCYQAVWFFETGKRKIPDRLIPKLSELFNVSIEELTCE